MNIHMPRDPVHPDCVHVYQSHAEAIDGNRTACIGNNATVSLAAVQLMTRFGPGLRSRVVAGGGAAVAGKIPRLRPRLADGASGGPAGGSPEPPPVGRRKNKP